MKQSLRFFSLGLLVSALLLFGFNFFFANSTNQSNASVEDMIDSLEEEGYRVVSEDEYISYTLQKDKADEAVDKEDTKTENAKDDKNKEETDKAKDEKDQKESKDEKADKEDKKEKEDKEDKDEVIKASFKTKSGVVSQEIADTLVEKKIITSKERGKFVKYLDDNGYSEYIQLGTFKVSSDMSFKELAETVTTYPGK